MMHSCNQSLSGPVSLVESRGPYRVNLAAIDHDTHLAIAGCPFATHHPDLSVCIRESGPWVPCAGLRPREDQTNPGTTPTRSRPYQRIRKPTGPPGTTRPRLFY